MYDGPEGPKPKACASVGYTQAQIETHRGMTAAAAECQCGTGAMQGGTCVSVAEGYVTTDCSGSVAMIPQCGSTSAYTKIKVPTPVLDGGPCTYANPSKTLPDASFAAVYVACGLPSPIACEGRSDCTKVPAPEVPFTKVCVFKEGDVACESEDYGVRVVTYKKITDTRDCSTCDGKGSGDCTTGYGFNGNQLACQTALTTATATAGTACVTAGGIYLNKLFAPNNVTCTVTDGGKPVGEAKSEEPITICCNK